MQPPAVKVEGHSLLHVSVWSSSLPTHIGTTHLHPGMKVVHCSWAHCLANKGSKALEPSILKCLNSNDIFS